MTYPPREQPVPLLPPLPLKHLFLALHELRLAFELLQMVLRNAGEVLIHPDVRRLCRLPLRFPRRVLHSNPSQRFSKSAQNGQKVSRK